MSQVTNRDGLAAACWLLAGWLDWLAALAGWLAGWLARAIHRSASNYAGRIGRGGSCCVSCLAGAPCAVLDYKLLWHAEEAEGFRLR